MNKKIFIFLPDGVGLRNFALSNFKQIGETQGFDITYWNNTPLSIGRNRGESSHLHGKDEAVDAISLVRLGD